eukprot:NODE_9582_length_579_cov_43.807018_g8945_i0.p1 GENE.NODE_9582_length_579_cov_43.807018_g8945_i0~~NODE_9582_length_579_cov_43.807018_g8945_i0.p1  ORF type:complete len:158 (+),score=52.71 NODE_9582_length_579_cov_43.807018_g8945_i0:41-475(+)
MCSDELKRELEKGREILNKRRDAEVEKKRRAARNLEPEPTDMEVDGAVLSKEAEDNSYLSTLGNKTGWYELCGVVTHKGRDADGGHYVAWVKHKDDWLLFDDNKVEVVREEKVKATHGGAADDHLAYLLIYRTRTIEGRVCGPP